MLLPTKFMAFLCLSIFTILPSASYCDTSYYEKYYTARRFLPQKRAALVQYNFTVTVYDELLTSFERLALSGDQTALGRWRPESAILLNRTQDHRVWSGTVELPQNSTVNYRYFIAAVDEKTPVGSAGLASIRVRRWESHVTPRSFNTSAKSDGNRTDAFGWIKATGSSGAQSLPPPFGELAEKHVQRGWLNTGQIVQLKFFREPLHIDDGALRGGEQLRVKIQPIEPHMLTPILPSAHAYTEYVRMVYGDSFLREQPEFGVPYKPGTDILMFHTTVSDVQKVAYLVKLYATTAQQGSDLVRLIGYQYIYPDVLIGSEGNFSINLISPVWFNAIGTLNLQYLVISPTPSASEAKSNIDFRSTFVEYWRTNWNGLDVGHRGLGKSLKVQSNSPAIVENTVASMKAAGELGGDMVEFDVMLTLDLVPIIYHDYMIYVCMDPKTPKTRDDLTEVLIKDITYEQLKNLKTYQIVGNKIIEYPAHNTVAHEDHRLFPLFEDYLTKVNTTVGFDIEIKWPQLKRNGVWESVQTIDKNLYIDRILEVMLRHGCGRMSFFSSFDADICTLLRFKQNMYPVMFLSSGKEATYEDPSSDTIYDTVNMAQAFDLAGIVPNAAFIQADPSWVDVARKQHKKIFVWGDSLKDAEKIDWVKRQGVSGAIYDRMDLWLPINKENIFDSESDLPGYFQLQCPFSGTSNEKLPAVNSTIESILSNVNLL